MSILKRIFYYFRQRFPLTTYIPLSFFVSFVITRNIQYSPSGAIHIVAISFFMFLLFLRAYDEIADFAHDNKHHKDRPLQSNKVFKKDIYLLMFLTILIQLLIVLIYSSFTSLFLLIAISFYMLVMKQERLMKPLEKQFFIIYILSHEVISLFISYYLFTLFGGVINEKQIGISLAIFFVFFMLEISRKYNRSIKEKGTYLCELGVQKTFALHIANAVGLMLLVVFAAKNRFYLLFFLLAAIIFNMIKSIKQKKVFAKQLYIVTIIFSIVSLLYFI